MRSLTVLAASLAGVCLAAPAMAATMQPPMGTFNDAFYTCDNNGAFNVSYDTAQPKLATMTTSNNNAQYVLKRKPVESGVQFSNGAVEFWTDGKTVIVKGAKFPLENCQLKPLS